MKRNRSGIDIKSRGFGIVGWLLMIPVAVIALFILAVGFYEGRKAYWDYRISEMCKKDGGVTVVEKMQISSEQYEKLPRVNNSPVIVSEKHSKSPEPVFAVDREMVLREWAPRVIRWESSVKRRSDGKVIGMLVTYIRSGGDFPLSFGHPTSFICPERKQFYADQSKFFLIEGKSK